MSLLDKLPKLAELERQATHNWKHYRDGESNNVRSKIITGNATFSSDKQHNCTCDSAIQDAELAVQLRNAAPAMLVVLAQFQPGDSRLLEKAVSEFERYGDEESRQIRACLCRLQEACKLMEANE